MQEKKFVPTKFWEIFKLRPPIITVGGGAETMVKSVKIRTRKNSVF